MVTGKEEWRSVVGYEGLYEVSNLGNVRSLDRTIPYKSVGKRAKAYGRQLQVIKNRTGYLRVNLCNDGDRKARFVHRLVAQAFIENPFNLPEINHKDENPANNSVENLEWCNAAYNNSYGTRLERATKNQRGKHTRRIMAIDPETGETAIFPSITFASRMGYQKSSIWYALQKDGCIYQGFEWRYADESDG